METKTEQEKILENNKERFLTLISMISRENSDIEGLIKKLEASDFFTAPASTQFHCSQPGGLCQHSLNVFDQLCKLIKIEYGDNPFEHPDQPTLCPFSKDSILIISLLHDISKMNYYETSFRNVKDEKGLWTKVPFIKVREVKERFLYSNHGSNSEYMIGRFIPLKIEESIAVINHMGASDPTNNPNLLSQVYNRYTLALLLHESDMLATFFDEKIED